MKPGATDSSPLGVTGSLSTFVSVVVTVYFTNVYFSLSHRYDFVGADGVAVKGNGYRTVVYFTARVMEPLHASLLKAAKSRSSFRFSASEHINSLYVHCSALQVSVQLMWRTYLIKGALKFSFRTGANILMSNVSGLLCCIDQVDSMGLLR